MAAGYRDFSCFSTSRLSENVNRIREDLEFPPKFRTTVVDQ